MLGMMWQVEEKGAVSQDLELYISKDHHEDGITLIARSEVRWPSMQGCRKVGLQTRLSCRCCCCCGCCC